MEFKKTLQPEKLNKLMENRDNIETRNIIIEHNLKLVKWVVNKYFYNYQNVEYEDLFQCGVLGLMTAIDKYDPHKGTFSNYAVWYIRQSIQRNMFTYSTDISLEDTIRGDSEDLIYKDTIPDPKRPFEEKVEEDLFAKQIRDQIKKELTDMEYNIIDKYYGFEGKEPQTFKQIGEYYNVPKNMIVDIRNKSFRKLRRGPTIRSIEREIDIRSSFYRNSTYSHTKSRTNYGYRESTVERLAIFREELRRQLERHYNIVPPVK